MSYLFSKELIWKFPIKQDCFKFLKYHFLIWINFLKNFHNFIKLLANIEENAKNQGSNLQKSKSDFFYFLFFDLHFCMTMPLRGW